MTATARRVAVLGLGSIGSRHVRVLRAMPAVDVIAIPARPRAVESGLTAATLADAVALGATACVIATNTSRHLDDARTALDLGLDALVEKPVTVDAAEAKLLHARATGSGRRLYVAYVLRFSTSLNQFRAALPDLGRLHAVRVECQSFLPDWRPGRPYRDSYSASASEGGVLRDLSHEIDYTGWIFGWPGALNAHIQNRGRLDIAGEEAADLMWESQDGCVVSIRIDFLTRPTRRRMVAQGEHGTLEWDCMADSVTLHLDGEPPRVVTAAQTVDERLAAQDAAFLAATDRQGQPSIDSRFASSEDGVRSMAICDAARRASATRCQSAVDYLG